MPRRTLTVRRLEEAIEAVVLAVPASREHAVTDPSTAAAALARRAARRAAALSGALALPPGPLGLLTIVPDLIAIWRLQAQLVSDIAGLFGREVELTRSHMLYCLFRHAASHAVRDLAARAGERVLVRQLTSGTLRSALTAIGFTVSRRLAGKAAGRVIPLAGAAAVAAYAYYDTLQVARTAIRVLGTHRDEPS